MVSDNPRAIGAAQDGGISAAAKSDSEIGLAVAKSLESGSLFGNAVKNDVTSTPVSTPSANMVQTPNVSGGLAATSVVPTVAPTLNSGVVNDAPNEAMFGDRTNGAGMMNGMNGLAASRFNQNKQNNPNQYGIMGGVNLL